MNKRWLQAAFMMWMWCGTGSCTHKTEQPAPAETCIADGTEQVSFSRHVVPVLTKHCAIAGCHAGASPAQNLNLEASVAYDQLMKDGWGYVDTLQPEHSLLYSQITAAANPMPPTGLMDDCSIRTILKWIRQKAKNN